MLRQILPTCIRKEIWRLVRRMCMELKGLKNEVNDHQRPWNVLMFEEILPTCIIKEIWRLKRRMCILTVGLKRLTEVSTKSTCSTRESSQSYLTYLYFNVTKKIASILGRLEKMLQTTVINPKEILIIILFSWGFLLWLFKVRALWLPEVKPGNSLSINYLFSTLNILKLCLSLTETGQISWPLSYL